MVFGCRPPSYLQVREWKNLVCYRIGGVEHIVSEVSIKSAMKLVASRLRLNVYLHSRGPALRRIEPVCDDLELIDGIMAVLRLPERVCGRILSRLLASTLIWIFPLSVAPSGEFVTSLLVIPDTSMTNCR